MGDLGLGLCSFAVGLPPAEVKRKIDLYRAAVATCSTPIGGIGSSTVWHSMSNRTHYPDGKTAPSKWNLPGIISRCSV